MVKKLILASASPRRRTLLAGLPWYFEVKVAEAEEISAAEKPELVPVLNAAKKAEAIPCTGDFLVMGADTVIILDGAILGKPGSIAEAEAMLTRLSGRTHEVITAVALRSRDKSEDFSVSTSVTFKPLTPEMIGDYLKKVHVLDKAGAYAAQEHGEMLIAAIDGSLNNVVGLPTEELETRLAQYELVYDVRQIPYRRRIAVLLWEYIKLTTIIIGGGYALIPAAESVFCRQRRWIGEDDLLEMIVITQSVPGILAGNSATCIGWKIAGFGGAMAALFGSVLPSLVIICIIAAGMRNVEITNPYIKGMFTGVISAIVGMVALTAWNLGKKAIRGAFEIMVALAMLFGMIVFKVNPGWLITGAIAAGVANVLLRKWILQRKGARL